jgi:hypothetical protein
MFRVGMHVLLAAPVVEACMPVLGSWLVVPVPACVLRKH